MSVTVLISLGACLAVAAPSAPEKAAAEALFEEGAALVEKGELATGCSKFAASQELDPTLGTLLRLGDCYDRLGKTASAWASFKQAASLARASAQSEREAIANERVADLETRLSRVRLVVGKANATPDLQIKLGGVVIPRASWGTLLPVDPGPQRVEASAPGHETWSQELVVLAGPASRDFEIPALKASVESAPSAEMPAPALPASLPDTERPGSGQRTAGYVLGGVGVAALAAGGVFAYLAYDKNQQSLDECLQNEPNACTAEGKSLRDDASSMAMLANVGVGAGAGLLITGAVLLFTAPDRERDSAKNQPVSLSARVSPGSFKLNLSGAF
jgi:serine/threonine-protein kinase